MYSRSTFERPEPLYLNSLCKGFACDNPVGTAAANALPCVNQDVVEKVSYVLRFRREFFFSFEIYVAERTCGNSSCKAYAG
jgi:hypothetical protein